MGTGATLTGYGIPAEQQEMYRKLSEIVSQQGERNGGLTGKQIQKELADLILDGFENGVEVGLLQLIAGCCNRTDLLVIVDVDSLFFWKLANHVEVFALKAEQVRTGIRD